MNILRTTLRGAAVLAALGGLAFPAAAQAPARESRGAPDLAAQNLNRVAASAPQIAAVLKMQAGLMVELKRMVAQEATDRGQVIEDADLTDDAVLRRLESDMAFRSVATRLLQKYGYLLPQWNPGSEAARERDLLLQERTRQMARAEAMEEEDARREARERRLDRARDSQEPAAPGADTRTLTRRAEGADREGPVPAPETRTDGNELLNQRKTTAVANAPETNEGPFSLRAVSSAPNLEGGAARPGPGNIALESLMTAAQLERNLSANAGDNGELDRGRASAGDSGPGTPAAGSGPRVRRPGDAGDSGDLVRRPNPFPEIPSLFDLYWQAPQQQGRLERFGLDVLRKPAPNKDFLPMDLPVGPDYVVGPGDGLAVDIWGGISQRVVRTVDSQGRVTLPEVGPVLVSGRSLGEVQRNVQQVLRTQFQDVSAEVSLSRLRSVRVYVVGEVAEPGAYDINSLSTPMNAVLAAGGPTDRGSARTVRHTRGKQLVQEVDLYDLLLRGMRSDLKRIQDGDTVLVPPVGPQVRVEGMVRRPAIYELRGEAPLAEVLELAGGILPVATLKNVQVQRLEAHQSRTMVSLDLDEKGRATAQGPWPSFQVRDGDQVRIFPISLQNPDAVFLQGHALRPGRYSFRAGMKVSDLLSSFQDLLPEPSQKYAEIIRLNPPDLRPSVQSFDLNAALTRPESAPALQPMDTVRVFSRYDFEEVPTVWVGGEVFRPGSYRTPGQVHLREAVHLAGGVTPYSQLDSAQVFRTLPDGTMKVFSVWLAGALAGNAADNIPLQPRDRLLIHALPSKTDPATVSVKGEVVKPGRYPLTANMRVSDLVRAAGGLKRGAFPDTADLTRFVAADGRATEASRMEVRLAPALAGDDEQNLNLRDGDVLAIRQVAGWTDLGASVTLRGEVVHPGVYGIQPGETLSSLLRRAGGLRATAYAQGAVLERNEVRELNERSRQDLIRRVESEAEKIELGLAAASPDQKPMQQAALAQRHRVLEQLRGAPASARLAIRLGPGGEKLAGAAHDIELRDGDRLTVPKQPGHVMVMGQVYNPTAIAFERRKNAGWYIERAGGVTRMAEKKDIFIIRANGSVETNDAGWWGSGVFSTSIQPGDVIVAPEKPIGESQFWKNTLAAAQIVGSIGLTAAVALRR